MIPRIVVDLSIGSEIGKILPDLDLLDVAYGATRGGVFGIMLPLEETGRNSRCTADLFDRPGLPVLTVKCEDTELERAAALGSAPDRIFVTGDRGGTVKDLTRLEEYVARGSGSNQEVAALIEPEAADLKSLARTGTGWAYFSTETIFKCESAEEAGSEHARLLSASLAANKLGLRVALHGPTGRQLPLALAAIPHVEEIAPTPDLWVLALRIGWESAAETYSRLLR